MSKLRFKVTPRKTPRRDPAAPAPMQPGQVAARRNVQVVSAAGVRVMWNDDVTECNTEVVLALRVLDAEIARHEEEIRLLQAARDALVRHTRRELGE
jgi:hypothetical protein